MNGYVCVVTRCVVLQMLEFSKIFTFGGQSGGWPWFLWHCMMSAYWPMSKEPTLNSKNLFIFKYLNNYYIIIQ